MKIAGIDKHITGHCACHSLGTLMKKKGLSDPQISDILGHTNSKFAAVYSRDTELVEKRALLEMVTS